MRILIFFSTSSSDADLHWRSPSWKVNEVCDLDIGSNTSSSIKTAITLLRSFPNAGAWWTPDSAPFIDVCCSKLLQTLSTIANDFPARIIGPVVIFAPNPCKTPFRRRFRCSWCRSHGILHPVLPCVLTYRDYSNWPAFLGENTFTWTSKFTASFK